MKLKYDYKHIYKREASWVNIHNVPYCNNFKHNFLKNERVKKFLI